jgi:hypothetical protein
VQRANKFIRNRVRTRKLGPEALDTLPSHDQFFTSTSSSRAGALQSPASASTPRREALRRACAIFWAGRGVGFGDVVR